MSIQLKQSLKLGQNLVMTPQLQQAIKMLQLNHLELSEIINQELTENPILEEAQDGESTVDTPEDYDQQDPEFEQQRDETAVNETQQPAEDTPLVSGQEDVNWEEYFENYNNTISSAPNMKEIPDEMPSQENLLTKTTSLEEHLIWQLSMLNLRDDEMDFAQSIVANLNDEGYLDSPIEPLAEQFGLPLEDAEAVLSMIHHLDPVGIGSRSLKECLLIQAKLLTPRQALVETIISQHLSELEKNNIPAISKALGVPVPTVLEAQKIIKEFEPKPGSLYTDQDPQYIAPDIYIYKVGQEFVISMNDDGIPRLKVSQAYRSIMSKKQTDLSEKEKSTREYVQEKLKSALWLSRSIENRQKTIYRVTEAILNRQREFFEKGSQFLKPMVLKDIASDVGLHESTISRVTTNKFVHTPLGTLELKYFFNSGVTTSGGGDSLASTAVKEKIKQLISKEDPRSPLSDQELADILSRQGIDIARRTVAKYREMQGILSSSRRKKVF